MGCCPPPPPLPSLSLPPPNQFRCVYLNCQRSFRRGGTDANGIRVPGDFNFHADSPDCTPAADSFDCAGLLWSHLATLICAHTHVSFSHRLALTHTWTDTRAEKDLALTTFHVHIKNRIFVAVFYSQYTILFFFHRMKVTVVNAQPWSFSQG